MTIINPTVANITLRSLFGRKRALLLLPVPILMIGLTVLAKAVANGPADWVDPLVRGLGFAVVVPIVALIIGTSVFGSEIDDGTIVHILTKPLARSEIVFAKLVVAATVAALVSGLTMLICGVIGVSFRFGIGIALGAAIGSICYCALFVMLSLITRRPALFGLVYIVVWESILGNILTGTRTLSVEQLSLSLAAKMANTNLFTTHVSTPVAIVMSCLFVVVPTVIAIDRLRSFTLAGETS
jgi:ABC-2 type transport system permease protein